MILERNELESMKTEDLKKLAVEIQVELTPQDSRKEIINRLIVKSAEEIQDQPQTPIEDVTQPKQTNVSITPIEDVKTALNPFILRGMKLYHNGQDNTWLIRIKMKPMMVRDTNTGESKMIERWRDDSGTLFQPIEAIKRCARVLMSNAPTAREVEPQRDAAKGYDAVA